MDRGGDFSNLAGVKGRPARRTQITYNDNNCFNFYFFFTGHIQTIVSRKSDFGKKTQEVFHFILVLYWVVELLQSLVMSSRFRGKVSKVGV